jgi:cold-inducible RNA-binding protein
LGSIFSSCLISFNLWPVLACHLGLRNNGSFIHFKTGKILYNSRMKNTHLAKTLTASLPGNARDLFTRISDPDNLPQWHPSFCRSLRRENGSLLVESPRGTVPVHFVRDDHSLVLDIVVLVAEGIKLTHAIRLLPNGEGSEIVWTLVKPEGITDSVFHEQLRWAGNALHALRKAPAPVAAVVASVPAVNGTEASESTEPLQAPSPAEVSSMPLSGKKLFIGNLAYDWTDEQLRAHFVEIGTVAVAEVARFRGRGGRSRGFGFVEMGSEAEAQSAIEKLHGGMAGGRQIIVRLAKSQESRPPKPVESPAEAAAPSDDAPEPGNERFPTTPAPSARQRSDRPRRGGPARGSERPSAPRRLGGGRARPAGSVGRPYQEHDISNKSGYEIFPRRSPASSEPSRPAPESSSPAREPSPYMDDTGDIENHGHRPPRHRRSR